ncbi:MAG: sugar transferase [Bacillota bacterium]|nr:sugar transferase [Bacillota bacterium]
MIGKYDITHGIDKISEYAKDADVLYLYKIPSAMRNDLLKFAASKGLYAYIQPKLGDLILNSTEQSSIFNLPVLRYNSRDSMSVYRIEKRIFDVLGSTLMLIATIPVFIVVTILIKLDDGGSVFYTQTRFTKDRKEFKLIKFRSMRTNAEADGVARLASKDDPRITRVGNWLRKTRLDELPQFINVLKGEMSIVGPRPERPEIAIQYEESLPEFSLRLLTKAGITGYAQIYGKYNTEPYDKLQMDLMYILNQSLWEDFKLTLLTLSVLLSKESTEGIEKGNVTAAKHHEA